MRLRSVQNVTSDGKMVKYNSPAQLGDVPGVYGDDNLTTLLTYFDGIYDASWNTRTIATFVKAQPSFDQIKFGTASTNFDGSSYLSTANSADFSFGTGDFTVEAWVNASAVSSTYRIIACGSQADGANNVWCLGYGVNGTWGAGNRLDFAYWNGSSYVDLVSSSFTHNTGQWYHFAVVRSSTTVYFFVNGTATGTVTISGSLAINGGATGLISGARYAAGNIIEYMNGYTDEVRVSKGIARWVSGFSPSTTRYAVDDFTKILLRANNGYLDRSNYIKRASFNVNSRID